MPHHAPGTGMLTAIRGSRRVPLVQVLESRLGVGRTSARAFSVLLVSVWKDYYWAAAVRNVSSLFEFWALSNRLVNI